MVNYVVNNSTNIDQRMFTGVLINVMHFLHRCFFINYIKIISHYHTATIAKCDIRKCRRIGQKYFLSNVISQVDSRNSVIKLLQKFKNIVTKNLLLATKKSSPAKVSAVHSASHMTSSRTSGSP